MKRFILFGIIGTIGFAVDSSLLLFLVNSQDFSIVFSRVFSFLSAVLVTWLLNRYFTFGKNPTNMKKSKEYVYYLIIQSIGAGLNFSIFFVLIYFVDSFKDMLIIPLAIGAGFSLVFNYVFIKKRIYSNESI